MPCTGTSGHLPEGENAPFQNRVQYRQAWLDNNLVVVMMLYVGFGVELERFFLAVRSD